MTVADTWHTTRAIFDPIARVVSRSSGPDPGGLCTGVRLLEAGYHDFVILEKAAGHRRHLVAQPLPGRRVRRQVAPVLLLVRPEPGVVAPVRPPAGDQGVPGRVRRAVRAPATPAARHRGPRRPLERRRRGLAAHRGRRRRGRRGRRRGQRARDVRRAGRSRNPRPRSLHRDDLPLRPLGRRARPHGRRGGGDRERGQRGAARPRDRADRRAARPVPTLGELGAPEGGRSVLRRAARHVPARHRRDHGVARLDLRDRRSQPDLRRPRAARAGRGRRTPQPRGRGGSGGAAEAHAEHAVRLQAAAGRRTSTTRRSTGPTWSW